MAELTFYDTLSSWFTRTQGANITAKGRIAKRWTWEDWRKFNSIPVSTLLEDDYFFGKRGKNLYDCHRQDIVDLFEEKTPESWPEWCGNMAVGKGNDVRVLISEQGTRAGKTWAAGLIQCILLFKNIIIPDYSKFYPAIAAQGGKLGFLAMSLNKTKAQDVLFREIYEPLLQSDFFTDYFPPNVTLDQVENFKRNPGVLRFPNNIGIACGSGMNAALEALGYALICCVMDEMNFYETVEGSTRREAIGGVYDAASTAFNEHYLRIDSQFNYKGRWPSNSLLIALSSAGFPDDFTETAFQENEKNPQWRFIHRRTWEARPQTFTGKYFDFNIGTMRPVDEAATVAEYEKLFGRNIQIDQLMQKEEDLD